MGEGGEGRRSLWHSAQRCPIRCVSHLASLVLVVMTVETKQFPVASVGRIVVMVMIFVMDRELAQLLAVEFSSAVPTDPWKHFERLFPIGLLQLGLGSPCHVSLEEKGDLSRSDSTESPKRNLSSYCLGDRGLIGHLETALLLNELCAGPTEHPDGWFEPS
jgi:hypothetical protein